MVEKELHLFIIWERARYKETDIINDIKANFTILKYFDIQWNSKNIASNFTRFYGTNLPAGSAKEVECGTGNFLLIVVFDENPQYANRLTSKGDAIVNTNMFDAKSKYRSWTGGGHKIHATNSPRETNHDLSLLLGVNSEDFLLNYQNTTDTIEYLKKDVAGADGWKDLSELFYVLSNTVDYVVLRGKDELLQNKFTNEHRDIDILTSDYLNAKYVINGTSSCNKYRPHERVMIDGYDYYLDLWQTQKNYFDPDWCKNMMNTRVRMGNYYFLDSTNEFYVLLYHCLIYKNNIADDYKTFIEERLSAMNNRNADLYELLIDFLTSHKYEIYFAPLDQSIKVHTCNNIIEKYACHYGRLISRNKIDCNGTHYSTKIYKRKNSFFKVGTKEIIDREYQFLKRLESEPYFPKVVDYGEIDTKSNYIEITACEGESPISFFEIPAHQHLHYIKSFVEETLKAISDLIKHNIIHRDILPQNILVTEKKGKCSISIIDFGWSANIGDKNTVTPQQLGGWYHDSNGYSDVYSLGVIINDIEKYHGTRYECRTSNLLKQIISIDYNDIQLLTRKIAQLQKHLSPTFLDQLSEWKFFIKNHYHRELLFSLLPFRVAYECRNLCRRIFARR